MRPPTKWVKIAGSEPPLLLEDRSSACVSRNGEREFVRWSFGVFGPVGSAGTLPAGMEVVPLKTKKDFAEAARLERLMEKSLKSQLAMFTAMGGRLE